LSFEYPEVGYARRILEIHGLAPPIKIVDLCRRYSSYIELPFAPFPQVDGVVWGLKTAAQTIFINSLKPVNRRRFTAAHELGHVIIPWHRGDIVEVATPDDAGDPTVKRFVASQDRDIEEQADRFAAELLMPSDWVRDLAVKSADLGDLAIQIADKAQVSLPAATLRASQLVMSDWTLVLEIEGQGVRYRIRDGSHSRALQRYSTINDIKKSKNHEGIATRSYGRYRISGFRPSIARLPELAPTAKTWRKSLKACLEANFGSSPERADAQARINAIFGCNAAPGLRNDELRLYSSLLLRFEGDIDFGHLLEDPFFVEYLVLRTRALVTRHQAKSRDQL
jgi:Zn-dependent peptidase ImmA (M78 family)